MLSEMTSNKTSTAVLILCCTALGAKSSTLPVERGTLLDPMKEFRLISHFPAIVGVLRVLMLMLVLQATFVRYWGSFEISG